MFNPILATTLITILGLGAGPMALAQSPSGAIAQQSGETLDALPIEQAFNNRFTSVQVLVSGEVISVLPAETTDSPYQQFLLEMPNGQQVLVAHDIRMAPPIPNLQAGDSLQVFGEYEWDENGGKIHRTYHDPSGQQIDGWIERDGVVFQ